MWYQKEKWRKQTQKILAGPEMISAFGVNKFIVKSVINFKMFGLFCFTSFDIVGTTVWLSADKLFVFCTKCFPCKSFGEKNLCRWKISSIPTCRGLYIGKYPPPPGGGGNISRCHLGEKIWKGEEKKGENIKEKGRKGKEKGGKGKENEKRGSKRVK